LAFPEIQEFLRADADRPPRGLAQAIESMKRSKNQAMQANQPLNVSVEYYEYFEGQKQKLKGRESEREGDIDIDMTSPASSGDKENKRHTNNVQLKDFSLIKVVGKGSFGKVMQVRKKTNGKMYAMKVLRKDHIERRNQSEHTKTERSVLGRIEHPFIVRLHFAFQTKDKLYFVLDYCAGGELFFHLGREGKFSEERAKFYTAEIVLALDHLHKLKIIYRDLKPENVLLDDKGHIRLTDFGLSKEGIEHFAIGATSFCGTPEYLAPEILNRSGHGRAVDWWSLGALLYEMLTGLPPFYSKDRELLFEKIRRGSLRFPSHLSENAVSLLRALLTRNPEERLGSGSEDSYEIRVHPFFASIDWEALVSGGVSVLTIFYLFIA
jgi:serum/glucocorticoid-regulated kinase 2